MAEASIEAGKGKVPDGPMMADVGDGTTAITLPERVDNSNVQAVLQSLEAECKARRLTKESRVLVDLVRLKEFDSTVLSALLEMGRYAGKPLAVHNPPRKLVSLAELYGVADFLLDDHPELRRMRQERGREGAVTEAGSRAASGAEGAADRPEVSAPSGVDPIVVEGVTKRFGDFRALDGIDLRIRQGDFFALLGPNGAGKTTLISIIAGLAHASSGRVSVMGHDVVKDYRRARASLGVVPQELVFDPFFTVRETLRITAGYYGVRGADAWIDEVLEGLGLTDKAESNMRALSGGMKRRVMVAQALIHRPPVIVLDEPTAGVDIELRQSLWRFVRKLNHDGHTIVLTTHYLEEAQALCNRVAVMKTGRIVALDETDALLKRFSAGALLLRISGGTLPASLQARRLPPLPEDDRYRLSLDDYAQIGPIMAAIQAEGGTIQDMEVTQPDLEDVFLRLMQEN